MDAILLLIIAAVPCLGLWALVSAKKRIVRLLGALFCSLTAGLVAGVVVGMSRAWSSGNGNVAFFGTALLSFVVLLPFALRKIAVESTEEPIQAAETTRGK
jgi:hypothetical protein